jgi:hypothetical protein
METVKLKIELDLSQYELLSLELEKRHLKMMPKNSVRLLLKPVTDEYILKRKNKFSTKSLLTFVI